jgi:hypothetical protein
MTHTYEAPVEPFKTWQHIKGEIGRLCTTIAGRVRVMRILAYEFRFIKLQGPIDEEARRLLFEGLDKIKKTADPQVVVSIIDFYMKEKPRYFETELATWIENQKIEPSIDMNTYASSDEHDHGRDAPSDD